MSEKTTNYSHQDLLKDNNINVADLPESTQKKITRFGTITDEEAKDELDVIIYELIEDYGEAEAKKAKRSSTKAKIAEHKKNKLDVSSAATAKTPEQEAADKAKADAAAAKEEIHTNTLFRKW